MQRYYMSIEERTAMHWRRINSPFLQASWEHALLQTGNYGKRLLAVIHQRIERWLILQDDLFGLTEDRNGVRSVNQMSTDGLSGLASCVIWWQFCEEVVRLEDFSRRSIGDNCEADDFRISLYNDIMIVMPEMFSPMDYLMRIGNNPSIGLVAGQITDAARESDPSYEQDRIEAYARYTLTAYRQFETLYGEMSLWERLTGLPVTQPMSLTAIQMEHVKSLSEEA